MEAHVSNSWHSVSMWTATFISLLLPWSFSGNNWNIFILEIQYFISGQTQHISFYFKAEVQQYIKIMAVCKSVDLLLWLQLKVFVGRKPCQLFCAVLLNVSFEPFFIQTLLFKAIESGNSSFMFLKDAELCSIEMEGAQYLLIAGSPSR